MKIIFYLIILGLIFSTSCGKKEAPERVEIRFLTSGTPEQNQLTYRIIEAFEKEYPHIKVKFEWGTAQLRTKILTECSAGTPPDVFYWCMEHIISLVERGIPADLTPFIKKYNLNLSDYFDCMVKAFTYKGKLWAFPMDFCTHCLAYNKNLFDKAGLSYPTNSWTWDDYLEASKKLTLDLDGDGRIDQFGTFFPDSDLWIRLNHGEIADLEKGECVLTSEEVKEALRFIFRIKKYCTSLVETKISPTALYSDFMTGKVAMQVTPTWVIHKFVEIKDFSWDVARLPKPPGKERKEFFGAGGLVLSDKSKHKDEAYLFMKFYCTEGAYHSMKLKNCLAAYKKATYEVFNIPPPAHIEYYIDAANVAQYTNLPLLKWNEIGMVIGPQIEGLILNKSEKEIDKVLAQIKVRVDEILKEK